MRSLRIEEVFMGAYVHVLREGGVFSPPVYVAGVNHVGSLLLDSSDSDEIMVSVLKNIYALPIDEGVLKGFGFVRARGESVWLRMFGTMRLTVSLRQHHGEVVCKRVAVTGGTVCWNEEIRYVHELQRWWVDKVLLPFGVPLVLDWDVSMAVREEREDV